ncbi:MAG: DUF2203 domain-containing protein [bacterium]
MASPRYFTVEEATAALPEVERLLERLRTLVEETDDENRLEEVMEGLEKIGCVVRDPNLGLVDFPALAGGTEVFLCWRIGEDAIGYWHGTTEGYAGRKPLHLLPGSHVH